MRVRWHQMTLRNRISYPYLSGDLFARNADLHVTDNFFVNDLNLTRKVSEAKVIFVQSHLLQDFFQLFGDKVKAKILFAGNSDFEFRKPLQNVPQSLVGIYLQNSFISDNETIFTLPIGLENLRLGFNGLPKLFKDQIPWAEKTDRFLLGPFGNTHESRISIINILKNESHVLDYYSGYISPMSLKRISNRYKFVIALRGNGVDTHRVWESLYRGSLPAVMKDAWSDSLIKQGFDIGQLTRWSTEELIGLMQMRANSEVRINEKLFWNYWHELIKSSI
jgi:hypothetical protein